MQKVKGAALNIYSNGFVPAMALLPTLSSFSPPPSFPVMYWIFIWSFGSDLPLWKCCWCRVTSGVRHAGLHRGRGQQDGGGGAGGRAHLPRHAHRLLQGEQRLVQRMDIFDLIRHQTQTQLRTMTRKSPTHVVKAEADDRGDELISVLDFNCFLSISADIKVPPWQCGKKRKCFSYHKHPKKLPPFL